LLIFTWFTRNFRKIFELQQKKNIYCWGSRNFSFNCGGLIAKKRRGDLPQFCPGLNAYMGSSRAVWKIIELLVLQAWCDGEEKSIKMATFAIFIFATIIIWSSTCLSSLWGVCWPNYFSRRYWHFLFQIFAHWIFPKENYE